MPTLFSLTLVEIIYSQLLSEVWTELKFTKCFLLWRTNPTISSALPVPPLPLRMLQANLVCKNTTLFYGKWSKRRCQKTVEALQPFPSPLDRCNYPVWDLAGVMEWMNRAAKLKFPEAPTTSSPLCRFFCCLHQKWRVPQHSYVQ